PLICSLQAITKKCQVVVTWHSSSNLQTCSWKTKKPLFPYLSAELYVESLAPLTAEQSLLRANISEHVCMLAGDIGARSLTEAPNGLFKAAEYIEHVFRKIGYEPVSQPFSAEVYKTGSRNAEKHSTRNIIAELKGTSLPKEVIIVGAHYDTEYL